MKLPLTMSIYESAKSILHPAATATPPCELVRDQHRSRSDGWLSGVVGTRPYNSGYNIVPAAAQNGVIAIAAGSEHVVALTTNGSVGGVGNNYSGQLNVPVAAQTGVVAI